MICYFSATGNSLWAARQLSETLNEPLVNIAEARKEKYLTKEEVKEIFNVCDATLWHWNKKGYLKIVKISNKVHYRQSDIRKILGERDGK